MWSYFTIFIKHTSFSIVKQAMDAEKWFTNIRFAVTVNSLTDAVDE